MKHKTIDINQRLPLDILYLALESYLNDNYDEDYILQQLRLEFKGENRLNKSLRLVNKIILRNPLVEFINENKQHLKQVLKNKADRQIILIALINSSFSFAYDTVQILGKFLSVQDMVNRETLRKSLSRIYGGNRATENAIDSVIPMLLEAGFIARPSLGVYKRNLELHYTSDLAKETYVESYKQNQQIIGGYQILVQTPYFLFLCD